MYQSVQQKSKQVEQTEDELRQTRVTNEASEVDDDVFKRPLSITKSIDLDTKTTSVRPPIDRIDRMDDCNQIELVDDCDLPPINLSRSQSRQSFRNALSGPKAHEYSLYEIPILHVKVQPSDSTAVGPEDPHPVRATPAFVADTPEKVPVKPSTLSARQPLIEEVEDDVALSTEAATQDHEDDRKLDESPIDKTPVEDLKLPPNFVRDRIKLLERQMSSPALSLSKDDGSVSLQRCESLATGVGGSRNMLKEDVQLPDIAQIIHHKPIADSPSSLSVSKLTEDEDNGYLTMDSKLNETDDLSISPINNACATSSEQSAVDSRLSVEHFEQFFNEANRAECSRRLITSRPPLPPTTLAKLKQSPSTMDEDPEADEERTIPLVAIPTAMAPSPVLSRRPNVSRANSHSSLHTPSESRETASLHISLNHSQQQLLASSTINRTTNVVIMNHTGHALLCPESLDANPAYESFEPYRSQLTTTSCRSQETSVTIDQQQTPIDCINEIEGSMIDTVESLSLSEMSRKPIESQMLTIGSAMNNQDASSLSRSAPYYYSDILPVHSKAASEVVSDESRPSLPTLSSRLNNVRQPIGSGLHREDVGRKVNQLDKNTLSESAVSALSAPADAISFESDVDCKQAVAETIQSRPEQFPSDSKTLEEKPSSSNVIVQPSRVSTACQTSLPEESPDEETKSTTNATIIESMPCFQFSKYGDSDPVYENVERYHHIELPPKPAHMKHVSQANSSPQSQSPVPMDDQAEVYNGDYLNRDMLRKASASFLNNSQSTLTDSSIVAANYDDGCTPRKTATTARDLRHASSPTVSGFSYDENRVLIDEDYLLGQDDGESKLRLRLQNENILPNGGNEKVLHSPSKWINEQNKLYSSKRNNGSSLVIGEKNVNQMIKCSNLVKAAQADALYANTLNYGHGLPIPQQPLPLHQPLLHTSSNGHTFQAQPMPPQMVKLQKLAKYHNYQNIYQNTN